jgi:hypothetical protein
LDVSLEATENYIVGNVANIVREMRVLSEPEALVTSFGTGG